MDERYLPMTRRGKLERLIEECAEVIQAAQKLKRWGAMPVDPHTGLSYDNIGKLYEEMSDLDHAMTALRNVDLMKLEQEP